MLLAWNSIGLPRAFARIAGISVCRRTDTQSLAGTAATVLGIQPRPKCRLPLMA